MDRLAALQLFIRVVESGSFSQAGRELGVGQPAVSKQVAALEQRLGAQLLNRTSRGLRPTPAGADFYKAAAQVLNDLDDAESRVGSGHELPNGDVRVAVPPVLTDVILVPALPEFFKRFPGIAIEFVVSERYADLIQEGLDMAIRVGYLDNFERLARRIGSMQIVTVASADYLAVHGMPVHPSDLRLHQVVTNRHLRATSSWRFNIRHQQELIPRLTGSFSCNNPADMHAAVLAGLGVAQSARVLFEAELGSGQVVEVLGDFVPDPLPIHVLHASGRVSHRVRVLSDFIAQRVKMRASLQSAAGYAAEE